MLIERNGSFFDEAQLKKSHGYEKLDPVGQEAFVNHIHLEGSGREQVAKQIINNWETEMKAKWPNVVFKIYLHREPEELTIRFHRHRLGVADWSEGDPTLSIITVG